MLKYNNMKMLTYVFFQMVRMLSGYLSADLRMITLILEVEHIETQQVEVKLTAVSNGWFGNCLVWNPGTS